MVSLCVLLMVSPLTSKHLILVFSFDAFKPAASEDTIKDLTYKPCYVAGATGLPSLDNIPSVADLTASFAARKEERLKQEAEKKEAERRVSISDSSASAEEDGGSGTLQTIIHPGIYSRCF